MPCSRSVVFSGYSGFPTNKTDRHDITDILLKVALSTITLTLHWICILFARVHLHCIYRMHSFSCSIFILRFQKQWCQILQVLVLSLLTCNRNCNSNIYTTIKPVLCDPSKRTGKYGHIRQVIA